MPIEVTHAVFPEKEAGRFPHIVKERRPTHEAIGGHAVDDMCRMLEYIVNMVRSVLFEPLHGDKLGQHARKHVDVLHKSASREGRGEKAIELMGDALRGNPVDDSFVGEHAEKCLLLDVEPELRGEAARSKDSQGVFGESLGWVSHRAYRFRLQVADAAVRVEQSAEGVESNGVYREIATREVLFDRRNELNGAWVARVAVGPVAPVGGHFERVVADKDGERAVCDSSFVGLKPRSFEERLGLLPRSVRGNVDIGAGAPEERIANEPAHKPRLEASRFKNADDTDCRFGKVGECVLRYLLYRIARSFIAYKRRERAAIIRHGKSSLHYFEKRACIIVEHSVVYTSCICKEGAVASHREGFSKLSKPLKTF